MRQGFSVLLLAVVAGGFMTPASAKVVLFKGVVGVYAASSACNILPYIEQGALYRTTYRPAGVGDNGSSTALILMPTAARLIDLLVSSYTMTDGTFAETFRQVSVSQTRSDSRLVLSLKRYFAQIRLIQQTPASLSTASFVDLKFQIHGFGGVTACTVTMHGFVGVGDSLTAG